MGNNNKWFHRRGRNFFWQKRINKMSKKLERNELLEPTGIRPDSILNICGSTSAAANGDKIPKTKPDFSTVFKNSSDVLSKVKNFMPQMKKADDDLKQKILDGQDVNIENLKENTKYVEMNVGLYENNKTEDWSEDSDPDSPGSPPERDNAYPSDSDSPSSDSVSTASTDSSRSPKKSPEFKLPLQQN